MKVSQQTISVVAVVTIILLLFIKIFGFEYKEGRDYFEGAYELENNRLDSLNSLLNSAKNRHDKLAYEKEDYVNGRERYSGFTSWIGVGRLNHLDGKSQIYISFANLGLKLNEVVSRSHLSFHTVDDQGYLSKMTFTKAASATKVAMIDQKVNYRYRLSENVIMVPSHSIWITTLMYALMFVIILGYLTMFLYALRTFFRFLFSISRNEAFTYQNTQRLRYIAILLLALAITPIVVNVFIYLGFITFYSSEGVIITYSFWKFDVYILILSILSYVIYTAFKQAMILQEESELTI